MLAAMSANASERTARAVADFYGDLVFPSRTSHPEYADLVPRQPGQRIGDFGCGQSIFYEALRDYVPSPVFVDLSQRALESIDYGARVRADLYRLPFATASFDRIFCIGVVHHLPEPDGVLREIARVLTPGGRLVLGVYAPGSAQSFLRRAYAARAPRPWRRAVFAFTERLVRARHARTGRHLDPADARARTQDFLDVPFVRYAAPRYYLDLAARAGLELHEMRRVSGMNLLLLGAREEGKR
jgi:SAM-dependent methyltransferase